MVMVMMMMMMMIKKMAIIDMRDHHHLDNFDDTDKTKGKAGDNEQKRKHSEKQGADSGTLLAG